MNLLALTFPRASRAPRVQRAFTLIEILVVIAIIVILAGIIVAISVGVTSSAKERATKATMDKLDLAMSVFMKDHPEPGPGPNAYIIALNSTTSTISSSVTKDGSGNPIINDGWGNPIVYVPAKSTGKNLPIGLFESAGRDGIMGNSDDIFSKGAAAQP